MSLLLSTVGPTFNLSRSKHESLAFSHKGRSFSIRPRDDRYMAMFENEDLGSYHKPLQAAKDLAGGHTFWPSCGDPSALGIPSELEGWKFIPDANRR